jgi:hypothetical protein
MNIFMIIFVAFCTFPAAMVDLIAPSVDAFEA